MLAGISCLPTNRKQRRWLICSKGLCISAFSHTHCTGCLTFLPRHPWLSAEEMSEVTSAIMKASHAVNLHANTILAVPYRLGPVPGMLSEAQLTSTSTMKGPSFLFLWLSPSPPSVFSFFPTRSKLTTAPHTSLPLLPPAGRPLGLTPPPCITLSPAQSTLQLFGPVPQAASASSKKELALH